MTDPSTAPSRHPWRIVVAALALALASSACGAIADAASDTSPPTVGSTAEASTIDTDTETNAVQVDLYDAAVVHTIDVEFDPDDYDEMIEVFTTTGEKEWISATVTIDGVTHDEVGLRLKGNSSLFGLTTETSGDPEQLPWLIKLNEFVDGADHQGHEEIVIRSNSTATAMNEAVAQQLLELAGLASQDPIATAFTVNGATELRLAVEHPDEEWYEDHFDDEDGLLYKADSEGDYLYRGDDPDAYTDVFDQKVGDDDLGPLIDFLEFVNLADDSTFADQLADRLDVEAFATYLAAQDLLGNNDDIDGRGNNSYLQYDTDLERFTVVSWDLNLAFDTANVGGGGGGRPEPRGDRGGGGPGAVSNVLVERFLAVPDFVAEYNARVEALAELFYRSGTVDAMIATWSDVLIGEAPELVDASSVVADAEAIRTYVDGVR